MNKVWQVLSSLFMLLFLCALMLILVFSCSDAHAQSTPGLVNGQIPTAAQWNSFFAAKQDYSTGQITANGTVSTAGDLVVWGSFPNVTDGGAVPSVVAGQCMGVTGNPAYTVAVSPACQGVRGFISGLTMSTAGSSSSFSTAIGAAMDGSNAVNIPLAASLTKTTGAWAQGGSNGCLDTGTIANSTWYHIFLIEKTDRSNTDILCSTSYASPTMPSNYTYSRYIGSLKTDSSAHWVKFWQFGDEFYWDTPVLDINTTTLSTTATNFALSVPPDISVTVKMRGNVTNGSAGVSVVVTSPLFATPTAASPAGETSGITQVASQASPMFVTTVTDTTQNVKAVASASSTTLKLDTYGWIDNRASQ